MDSKTLHSRGFKADEVLLIGKLLNDAVEQNGTDVSALPTPERDSNAGKRLVATAMNHQEQERMAREYAGE